jgi:hypothetical protein
MAGSPATPGVLRGGDLGALADAGRTDDDVALRRIYDGSEAFARMLEQSRSGRRERHGR